MRLPVALLARHPSDGFARGGHLEVELGQKRLGDRHALTLLSLDLGIIPDHDASLYRDGCLNSLSRRGRRAERRGLVKVGLRSAWNGKSETGRTGTRGCLRTFECRASGDGR